MALLSNVIQELEGVLINGFDALLRSDLSQAEKYQLVYQFDALQQLDQAGYQTVFQQIESEYGIILNELLDEVEAVGVSVRPANLGFIDDILSLQKEYVGKTFEASFNQLQSNTLLGLLTGESTEVTVNRLRELGLPRNQVLTLVDTTKDIMRATAKAKIYEDEPDTRFILDGILDDRTRCECQAVLFNQPSKGFTKQEIDKGAATKLVKTNCPKVKPESQTYSWNDRGGFNCRHNWVNVKFKRIADE